MTISDLLAEDWATRPFGKAARAAIAVVGAVTAFLTLMVATAVDTGGWFLIVAGVGLAATSARAARVPSLARLTTLMANLVLIPMALPLF